MTNPVNNPAITINITNPANQIPVQQPLYPHPPVHQHYHQYNSSAQGDYYCTNPIAHQNPYYANYNQPQPQIVYYPYQPESLNQLSQYPQNSQLQQGVSNNIQPVPSGTSGQVEYVQPVPQYAQVPQAQPQGQPVPQYAQAPQAQPQGHPVPQYAQAPQAQPQGQPVPQYAQAPQAQPQGQPVPQYVQAPQAQPQGQPVPQYAQAPAQVAEAQQPQQPQQAYPAQYYLNNYYPANSVPQGSVANQQPIDSVPQNYTQQSVPAQQGGAVSQQAMPVENYQQAQNSLPYQMTAPVNYPPEYLQENMDVSNGIINNLDAQLAAQREAQKKTKKVRVVALTNEYIMSLENYLNNPNKEVRLMASKEVLKRFNEDRDRYNDAALNALINKMLQDPEKLVRIAALSALSSELASGNEYTVTLLQRIQANPKSSPEDVMEAANILLKMSAVKEFRYLPEEKAQVNMNKQKK